MFDNNKKDPLISVAYVLLIIGGLNWGITGLLGRDLLSIVFGYMSVLSRLLYILVGAAAIYVLVKSYGPQKASSTDDMFKTQ